MTADELKSALARLGWTQQITAYWLGVNVRSMSRWCTGASPIPEAIAVAVNKTIETLDLGMALAMSNRRFEEKIRRDASGKLHCTFCDKEKSEVLVLISGKHGYICDECLDVCAEIVKEARAKKAAAQCTQMPGLDCTGPRVT